MKLKHFEHQQDYCFKFVFENNETKEADLKTLIGSFVEESQLNTARIDTEWGCLEFKNGTVDIEPKTLYHYCQ
jgi:hypothetical protein